MERIKTYRTNTLLASVIILMILAGIFSIDLEKLLKFYNDPVLSTVLLFGIIIFPALFFFGFRVYLLEDEIVYRHNLFFRKKLKISALSQILYEPTWRGITPKNTNTTMRSLQIVQGAGGFGDKIYLANGAFLEKDLADIARRLESMNPRVELDTYAKALIQKN